MLRRECNYYEESLEGYGKAGFQGGRRPTIPEVNSTLDDVLTGWDFSLSSSNLRGEEEEEEEEEEEDEDKWPPQPSFKSREQSGNASIGYTSPMVPQQEFGPSGKTYRAMAGHVKQCPVRQGIAQRMIMQPPIRGPTTAHMVATRQERLAWRPMPDTTLSKVGEECPQPALQSREEERIDISNSRAGSWRLECLYCGKSCKTNRGRTHHMNACQVRRGLTLRTIPYGVHGPTLEETMAAKEARGNRRKQQGVTMTDACLELELQEEEDARKRAHGHPSTRFDCAYCGRTFVTHRGMMMHLNHCQISRALGPRIIPLRPREKCPQPDFENFEERRDCYHCRRNFETHRGLMMHMNHCMVVRRLSRDGQSRWAAKKARLARGTTSTTTACAEQAQPQPGQERGGDSGDGTISDDSSRWNREREVSGKIKETNGVVTMLHHYCEVGRHDARRKSPLVPEFSSEFNVHAGQPQRLVPQGMDQYQPLSEDETRDATTDGEPQTRSILAKTWEWDRRSSNSLPGVGSVRPKAVAETKVPMEQGREWAGILRWQWKVAQEASILYGG